jgi:hypothetical protein
MSGPKRDGDTGPDDGGYLPGVPNIIRNLIGQADALLIQKLTSVELERLADTEQTLERLKKAKNELVRKVLVRGVTDWRDRLTSLERDCLEKGDVAEDALRVTVARREMSREEWIEYEDIEEQLGEAWETHDGLMRVAMERGEEDNQ